MSVMLLEMGGTVVGELRCTAEWGGPCEYRSREKTPGTRYCTHTAYEERTSSAISGGIQMQEHAVGGWVRCCCRGVTLGSHWHATTLRLCRWGAASACLATATMTWTRRAATRRRWVAHSAAMAGPSRVWLWRRILVVYQGPHAPTLISSADV